MGERKVLLVTSLDLFKITEIAPDVRNYFCVTIKYKYHVFNLEYQDNNHAEHLFGNLRTKRSIRIMMEKFAWQILQDIKKALDIVFLLKS